MPMRPKKKETMTSDKAQKVEKLARQILKLKRQKAKLTGKKPGQGPSAKKKRKDL